jgi:transposase
MPKIPPYSLEFREEAVRLLRSSGRTVPQLARKLGCSPQSLRNWARQIDVDEGKAAGLSSDEREELRRLRRELRTVTEEREILRKPRPSSPRKAGPGEKLPFHRGEAGRALDPDHVPRAGSQPVGLSRLDGTRALGARGRRSGAERPDRRPSSRSGWVTTHLCSSPADWSRKTRMQSKRACHRLYALRAPFPRSPLAPTELPNLALRRSVVAWSLASEAQRWPSVFLSNGPRHKDLGFGSEVVPFPGVIPRSTKGVQSQFAAASASPPPRNGASAWGRGRSDHWLL